LLRKREDLRAHQPRGMTIVPLDLLQRPRHRKCQLGRRGQRMVDSAHTIKDRDWQREQARVLGSGTV
jgi:tmRNA-binding protein